MARRRGDSSLTTSPVSTATLIRSAFAFEAVLNILGGAIMVLYPKQILAWAKPNATLAQTFANPSAWVPAPQAAILLQWLGALVIAMATPLISGFYNGSGAVEKRKQAYQSLLVGEVALVGAMVWQLFTSPEMTRAISDKAITLCASVLCGPLVWRLFCLTVKPSWFGETSSDGDSEKRA